MPKPLLFLLDQNVPRAVRTWLQNYNSSWQVYHAGDENLGAASDNLIYDWAQERGAIIITFDEDFADHRFFARESHHGIIRLRVWPTTVEETVTALERVLTEIPEDSLQGALIIVDPHKIRVRFSRAS